MSPLSAAATETLLDTKPSSTANPTVVTVMLEFRGVTFSPGALYDALNAAYGTVATDKDNFPDRGPFNFVVTP